jgi:hypothetical protein
VTVPDEAQAFVSLVTFDLTTALDVPEGALTLVELSAATWHTPDHGCGEMPYTGNSTVEIPGYRIVFAVNGGTYAYHTDSEGTIRRCARPDVVIGEQHTLIEVDPVAAELVALAQRRVAALANTQAQAVDLVSVRPYRWRDASLGCPLPDETYTSIEIDGYRIVLAAGGDEYVFHTSFTDLVRCPPGNEVLP